MLEIRSIENPVLDLRDDRFEYFESGADYKNKTGQEPPYLPGKPCKMWRPKVAEDQFQPMLVHRLPVESWYSLEPATDETGKPLMESVFLTKGRAYFLNFWPGYAITDDAQKLGPTEDPPLRKPLEHEQLYRSWFPGAPNTWADSRKQVAVKVEAQTAAIDLEWVKSALRKIAEAVGAKL